MKKIRITFFALILINLLSCNSEIDSKCNLKKIKTLFVTEGVYEGKTTGYCHYILINDFSRNCMDSVSMVNMALRYMDTVKIGRPADMFKFFNSDKDFIPNETSQVMEDINKSCLVTIGFDLITLKPNNFIFYDSDGRQICWGDTWTPPKFQ